jgi:hypothetical protein
VVAVLKRVLVLGGLLLAVGPWYAQGLPPLPPPPITGSVTNVVDGVTVEVRIDHVPTPAPAGLAVGQLVRVRYLGLVIAGNGAAARDLNALLVGGRQVYLELDAQGRDPNGDLPAYVYLDPGGRVMVNLILLATDLYSPRTEPGATRYASVFAHAAATPSPVSLGCSPAVPWSEARARIGEVLCVEGPVMSVGKSAGGDVFLDLGLAYPNPERFTLFIPARHVGKFEAAYGARFWEKLKGTVVRARGEIKLYRGVAEIVLSDPKDLYLQP